MVRDYSTDVLPPATVSTISPSGMAYQGIASRQHADNHESLRQSACFQFTKCHTLAAVRKEDPGHAVFHAGDQAQREEWSRVSSGGGAPYFIT